MQQWVTVHPSLLAATAAILLGALVSLYGTARGWVFLTDVLPGGWLIAAVTFIALTPERPQDRRLVVLTRSLLWSIPLVVCLLEIGGYRLSLQDWDLLWVSALLTLVIGLELTTLTPMRLRSVLQRLLNREVLREPANATDRVENDLERAGDRWSLIGGWVVAAATLTAFLVAYTLLGPSHLGDYVADIFANIFSVIFPAMAGFVVGRRIGRMVGYGRLLAILNKRGAQLYVIPGHPDGAGGLEPIGAFYLHQSRIASVPAIFLAVWVLLMSVWSRYWKLGHIYRGMARSLPRVAGAGDPSRGVGLHPANVLRPRSYAEAEGGVRGPRLLVHPL
jgi:hypothetical protein